MNHVWNSKRDFYRDVWQESREWTVIVRVLHVCHDTWDKVKAEQSACLFPCSGDNRETEESHCREGFPPRCCCYDSHKSEGVDGKRGIESESKKRSELGDNTKLQVYRTCINLLGVNLSYCQMRTIVRHWVVPVDPGESLWWCCHDKDTKWRRPNVI